jgi:hypothetical protein
MYHGPFLGQTQSPPWQFAFDHLKGVDVNGSLELTISRVKVWRP